MSNEEPGSAWVSLPFLLSELETLTATERQVKAELAKVRAAVNLALKSIELKGEVGSGRIRVGIVERQPPVLRAPGWLEAVQRIAPEHVHTVTEVREKFEEFMDARARSIWDGKSEPASDGERELLTFLGLGTPAEPYLRVRWVGSESGADGESG